MNNNSSTQVSFGGGFCGLLALVFITLKLIGIIDWPWIWVLAPIWIPLALVFIGFLVIFLIYFILNR